MSFLISENQNIFLSLCSDSLFNKKVLITNEFDVQNILTEAKQQAVFPLIYSQIKDKCSSSDCELFWGIVTQNIRVEYAHNEIDKVFEKFNVKYVVLKGVSSATYYRDPHLRTMGDVDVLILDNDVLSADKALKSIGFTTDEKFDTENMHISYKRKDGTVCELHFGINGVPKNNKTETVNSLLSDIFKKSFKYKTENGTCVLPSRFHHGIILLLHTVAHLTNEGIGLRHLCDWAVFANSFSNEEFVELFEKPLKKIGLWHFAQLLTSTSVKYLGSDRKDWAGTADDALTERIIIDILNGGNFGFKDVDRYRQIKYISDRENGTVSRSKPLAQLFSSINAKTKSEVKLTQKYRFLLPLGYVVTVFKYFWLLLSGERKIDKFSTVDAARQRKNIYDEFRLFEDE